MDFTWYLYPGQTLENTTPEQRGKALMATPSAWKKIANRQGQKKIKQELLDQEHARNEYLKEGSKAMTQNWANTIEKTRERQRNLIDNRIQEREIKHYEQYIKLRENQKQERDFLVNEAHTKIYMSTQEPRTVTSALLFTETMFERDLQNQFKKYEYEHQKFEEIKEAKLIQENAKKEILENMEKRRKRKELDLKNNEEILKHINEMKAKANKINGEQVLAEKVANLMAEKELKEISDSEKQLIKESKEDFKRQLDEMQNIQRHYKTQRKLQDETEDKIISIYSKAKCRMEAIKKQRVKEMQESMIAVRGNMAAHLMKGMTVKEDNETRIIENAQREKDQKEQQQAEEKDEYKNKLLKEKLEYIKEVKEKKIKQEELEKEVKKWEMINKIKTKEIMGKYDQNKAQKIFDEKIKYRKILQKQIADRKVKDYEKICAEQVSKYYKEKNEAEDKAYFNYASDVLDLAKSRGRDTKPIEKAIEQYKLENQLQPKNKNLRNLQSNVPINNNKNICK